MGRGGAGVWGAVDPRRTRRSQEGWKGGVKEKGADTVFRGGGSLRANYAARSEAEEPEVLPGKSAEGDCDVIQGRVKVERSGGTSYDTGVTCVFTEGDL